MLCPEPSRTGQDLAIALNWSGDGEAFIIVRTSHLPTSKEDGEGDCDYTNKKVSNEQEASLVKRQLPIAPS
jgi:hypothetical protein